jgi:hypothetical protein
MLDDSETIAVKFKRKLCYKHQVSYEKVRPNKVMEAAKWLVQNSSLFILTLQELWGILNHLLCNMVAFYHF